MKEEKNTKKRMKQETDPVDTIVEFIGDDNKRIKLEPQEEKPEKLVIEVIEENRLATFLADVEKHQNIYKSQGGFSMHPFYFESMYLLDDRRRRDMISLATFISLADPYWTSTMFVKKINTKKLDLEGNTCFPVPKCKKINLVDGKFYLTMNVVYARNGITPSNDTERLILEGKRKKLGYKVEGKRVDRTSWEGVGGTKSKHQACVRIELTLMLKLWLMSTPGKRSLISTHYERPLRLMPNCNTKLCVHPAHWAFCHAKSNEYFEFK